MEGVARLKLDSNRAGYIVVGPGAPSGDPERGSCRRPARHLWDDGPVSTPQSRLADRAVETLLRRAASTAA